MKPHYYNCTLVRVIDGDTIDVDIDLGFNVWIRKSRVLGIPFTMDNKNICDILVKENHAVEYWGGKKIKVWG